MNDSFLRHADETSRRRFLSYASRTLLGVSILPAISPWMAQGVPVATISRGAAVAPAGRKPTARNIIYLYMAGGMTHVDTFDPKPAAGEKVAGPVKAIQTAADGVQISEYFPLLAGQMDKVAVVRGLSTTQGAHEEGNYFMHSSYTRRGTIQHPGMGAWLLRMEGKTNRTLPGSVCIGGGSVGGGAGFLESKYAPLYVGSPTSGVPNSRANVSTTEFENRRMLANKFDQVFHEKYDQKKVRAYSDMYDDAVRLMKSEDLKAFDLGHESPEVRAEYGDNGFGQGCLLARRLVENDVRHVEVTLGGWDTHSNNFQAVERLSATLDRALAALLKDLERRGLLEETMVVLCTEFGRTPYINENDGRDHYPKAFSALIAGGGIRGGTVHGETDEAGMEVVQGKVSVPDFNATIAHGLGLPLDQTIYSPSKRPFTIADQGQPISSLFS